MEWVVTHDFEADWHTPRLVIEDEAIVTQLSRSTVALGSTRRSPGFFRGVGSSSLRLFRFRTSDLNDASARHERRLEEGRARTFSSSSFRFASSSAFFFSSSAFCFALTPFCAPPLFFFFASRAAFSSSLIRFIRGSCASARSTIPRSRAVSSFLRRARSDLFFFSVYRLSSRLHACQHRECLHIERLLTCHCPR